MSINFQFLILVLVTIFSSVTHESDAQIVDANRSGFTWINTESVTDNSFGSGFTLYSAGWSVFENYPGTPGFQMGLAGSWLTTQRTGNEPIDFYTTIEGGLGWWGDTRFGKEAPKFIMGGVSHNFFAWANGPGAGQSDNLSNGQRDWSTPGGKYGVAQLSNRLLWAPDGLNMAQGLNGELLGYGYSPLPISDPLTQTAGIDIETGNQCWTLFINSTNFKGPATFFLPTFWTKPVLEDPSLEGLFLDSRPSDPNVGLGLEHADSPAIISNDNNGVPYAKTAHMQMPICGENNSMLMNGFRVYNQDALWNNMESWFDGGDVVATEFSAVGTNEVPFVNNGGDMIGEISYNETENDIDLAFMDNVQQSSNSMGYVFDRNVVEKSEDYFLLPDYYRLDSDDNWHAVKAEDVPLSTNLLSTDVPVNPRSEITYLTPLEPDCAWQDSNGAWNNPGPSAGPYYADLGDGSTVTYYWYRFVDQPAIVQANLPEEVRQNMQARVELMHSNWSHTDEYLAAPPVGNLATIDPEIIVNPPSGFEVGYVPIVTRQQKTLSKLRVFVLAGQSNMEGQGTIVDPENDPGSLQYVIENDVDGIWSDLGTADNWNTMENAFLYYENNNTTIKTNVTVGQGANPNLIGPELMFAQQLDEYYDDPILIIKTAWGGKNLAEDFRPPSAGGTTGEFYDLMIEKVNFVTQNLDTEFPSIDETEIEISGFAWFQGWNDGATDDFLNEYESNLTHLVSDVRNDLGISDLPFVVASAGHGGYATTNDGWVQSMQNIVAEAQQNVGCDDETYKGKVGFVDTKQYYIGLDESPLDAIHHYNNNALTFLNVGKAMGNEMIMAINDMSYCSSNCDAELIEPDLVSIGNRVWNDYNRDGFNDPNEPGIAGVSVLLWYDSNGDDIPDAEGFGGIQITDAEGYYRFEGLLPGNYVTFVWQVDNWGPGEPLENFVSTNEFEADANNDIDFDNNGSGNPFQDIFSGIVTLTVDGEPLNDGDPENGLFDLDPAGNNTVDFGFYNPTVEDIDGDGFSSADDCDDFNANVNPDQIEVPYNGLDDDCDPSTLDDDLDQDGWNLLNDCDDNNPDVHPFLEEIPYNGLDDDCNSNSLDDDLDQDGFVFADDCDDTNPNINPDATDIPNNNIDEDCNGVDANAIIDNDNDGFDNTVDCDDSNPDINPGIVEVAYNGIDDDCDPSTSDDDLDQDGFLLADDCDDNDASINLNQIEVAYNGIDDDCNPSTLDDDLDQDGFVLADDCDDTDASINTSQAEVAYNGVDDDCDPSTLDDDLDQDGFDFEDDCNDTDASINPDAEEIANNDIDEDCDGVDLLTSLTELTNNDFTIFPNPASHFIIVQFEKQIEYSIEVYDLLGNLVVSQENFNKVSVADLQSGQYFMVIEDLKSRKTVANKVIVMR